MSLARIKVWNPGEILTASDLNGEFNNIIDNANAVDVVSDGSTTARDLSARFADIKNVMDYGATGNGVTDDTAAIQAAITAAQAVGAIVFLPPGRFLISSTLAITGGCTIAGSGAQSIYDANNGLSGGGSVIFTASTTMDGISVNTTDACHFRDFTLVGSSTASDGSGFYITGGTVDGISGCQRPTFHRLTIYGFFRGIEYDACVFSTVSSCVIVNYTDAGMLIQNTVNGDHGDNHVTDCLFSGATTGVIAGIRWHSSGGLYVTSTKILGNSIGIHLTLAANVQTVDFHVIGCSIENWSVQGIQIAATNAGTSFYNAQIMGNNVSSTAASGVGMLAQAGAATALESVIITGNSIKALAEGVSIATNVGNFVVANNSIYDANIGIVLNSTGVGDVHDNRFKAVTGLYQMTAAPAVILKELNPFFVFNIAPTVADGSQIYFSDIESAADVGYVHGGITAGGTGNMGFRAAGAWLAL